MTIGDDLERALRTSWNTADLAVYADHLQSLGDPRGELIALDLHPRTDRAWRDRRRALLDAWLGAELAATAGHLVQHGFIHELRRPIRTLLDGPLGEVVRGVSTPHLARLPPSTVAEDLGHLARRPRPWLTRLVVEYSGSEPCSDELAAALIAATPNLVELYAIGDRLFESFHHPALRRLYVTPLFQQPPTGVPATGAETIEIFECGYVDTQLANGRLQTFLEAIDTTPDCNQLYATCADLVGEHDSFPATLARLHEVKLVELDGTLVRLSAIGRGLLHFRVVPGAPPRVPPSDDNNRKWVLWAEGSPSRRGQQERDDLFIAGLLRMHSELLVACLDHMPLEQDVQRPIRDYLEFLCTVVAAGEWTDVYYRGDLGTLIAAMRTLLAFHHLRDYHLDLFGHVGDDSAWSGLEGLVDMLERLHASTTRAMFRVAWGF